MLMRTTVCLMLTILFGSPVYGADRGDRPNIVWLVSEDSSQHFFRLFDPSGAATPRIEQMATEGVVFRHAFSCAPVCSVARTTLMTGIYAPRIAAQFHRPLQLATLPPDWKLFPAYLRAAGYYTTNNSKKDYNVVETDDVWDESSRTASWRGRPDKTTPFFHMQSFPVSHESSLHFPASQLPEAMSALTTAVDDPSSVRLADYHPDTPLFRYTYQRYHDRIEQLDQQIGQVLDQLEADGELENTFVFFFGDHGGVLPGSKGYLRETGLHVPLVIRIPAEYRTALPERAGGESERFVSFVDLGPTVLALAGVDVPKHMNGHPIWSADSESNEPLESERAIGYADRFDEKMDLSRSLRRGQYKYIRNFLPYYPDGLQNNYRYRMLAYQQWRELYGAGQLTPVQGAFFQPKPAESLFDVQADPYEIHDLAKLDEYRSVLVECRMELHQRMAELPDLSMYPESHLIQEAVADPIDFGHRKREEIGRLIRLSQRALEPLDVAAPDVREALQSDNPWFRYWGAIVCASWGSDARSWEQIVEPLLEDSEPMVRIRAAECVAQWGNVRAASTLQEIVAESRSDAVVLAALNAIVYLRDHVAAFGSIFPVELNSQVSNDEVQRRLEYLRRPQSTRLLNLNNLVAWCIVPFDAARRSPPERAAMLKSLGIRKVAYDWREEHVPSFEEEILEYQRQGLEYFAFWSVHPEALRLFRKYDLHPQIWLTNPDSPAAGGSESEAVARAAEELEPAVRQCLDGGCPVGLYNHGGWGGEPRHLVAVCQELRRRLSTEKVGIVYNFHHAHDAVDSFADDLQWMMPYLYCVNLNGMVRSGDPQILPIGDGELESGMIRELLSSGYRGPIGILDHRNEVDAEQSLRQNLRGLAELRCEWLLGD